MKSFFDYIPAYCPNCRHELEMDKFTINEFYNGDVMMCPNCGAEFEYARSLKDTQIP